MKLTKKEQTTLQELVEQIKQVESAIGQLELQKSNAVIALRSMMESLNDLRTSIGDKYGNVNIDVATGNFK